jgi:AcrR family transcriptional regulator
MGRRRLHDEALGERLLDEAAARIAEHGPDGLSLRALAASADTTTAAVYTIFGGKPGLLGALHERAFSRFGAAQAAVPVSEDPIEDLVQLGLAYRRSALGDPHGYRIMFGSEVPPARVSITLRDKAADTFLPLLNAVRRGVSRGQLASTVPAESIATALWANVHGLVSLELGEFMPPTAGDPADVFEDAVRATVRGWASSASGKEGAG